MLTLKPSYVSAALGVAAAVTATTLIVAPAQAVQLVGDITINGNSRTSFNSTRTIGTITFKDLDNIETTGNFSSFVAPLSVAQNTPNASPHAIKPLTLTGGFPFFYKTPLVTSFLDFGTRTLGATTANLTFDLDPAVWVATPFGGFNIASYPSFSIPATGKWVFNGNTIAEAGVSFTQVPRSVGSYTISIHSTAVPTISIHSTAVPEPLTILGTGTALGFGAFFKRNLAEKKKKENAKA